MTRRGPGDAVSKGGRGSERQASATFTRPGPRFGNKAQGTRETDLLGCIRYHAALFLTAELFLQIISFSFSSCALSAFLPISTRCRHTDLLNTQFRFPKCRVTEPKMPSQACSRRAAGGKGAAPETRVTPLAPRLNPTYHVNIHPPGSLLIQREVGGGRDVEPKQL